MSEILVSLGGICIFVGVAIPAYQAFLWLRHGQWTPLTVLDALKYIDMNSEKPNHWTWLYFPQDWLGLHQVLEKAPLALFIFLLAFPIFWLAAVAAEKEQELKERQERSRLEKERQKSEQKGEDAG